MTTDAYRKAYETAIEDLTQISQTFERLSARKKLVENVLAALQPVFASTDTAASEVPPHVQMDSPQASQETQTEGSETAFSFLDVPAPLPAETDGDPFQRRVKANFRFKGLATQRAF